jgi:hypothetical protein
VRSALASSLSPQGKIRVATRPRALRPRKPETIAVAVGAFADPAFPPPSKVVYEEHRHPWVEMTI